MVHLGVVLVWLLVFLEEVQKEYVGSF